MKKNLATWVFQAAVALFFLGVGSGKLAATPPFVQVFDGIGLGQWFRDLTGLMEVGGAILLLTPRFAVFGAVTLATVMAGAILTHAFVLGGSAVPAIVLFAATIAIAWLRREQVRVRVASRTA